MSFYEDLILHYSKDLVYPYHLTEVNGEPKHIDDTIVVARTDTGNKLLTLKVRLFIDGKRRFETLIGTPLYGFRIKKLK